jgi:exosortase A-associated hydrolase 2
MSAVPGPAVEPFFLPAEHGERFCIFHPAVGALRGGIVYIHPFAEEMNKSRRMAAVQSRAFAQQGYAVLQIDLFGCGDSSGDFGEASWATWQQDVALAVRWLSKRVERSIDGGITLWGLRLGALLALDAAPLCDPKPVGFVLWQPVLSGEALLTQFLRLRVTSEMMAEGSAKTGVRELRAQLASGESLEIAGYTLSPQLTAPIDGLKLVDKVSQGQTVQWLEVVPEQGRALPPAAQRVADACQSNGIRLAVQCVPGEPFWNTVETTECPALIAATTAILAAVA